MQTRFNMKQIAYMIIPLIAIALFWNSLLIAPLKILVVFFHEASHVIATILTGGQVMNMEINSGFSGQVISKGGWRFVILSSGYLGSLIWGVVIFSIAFKSQLDKFASIFLGCMIILLTIFFIRNIFGVIFSCLSGLAFIYTGWKFSENTNDLILKITGLTSIIYAPLDIFSDIILHSSLKSDARMLAEEFGGTTIMWGIIWLSISLIIVLWAIRYNFRQSDNN